MKCSNCLKDVLFAETHYNHKQHRWNCIPNNLGIDKTNSSALKVLDICSGMGGFSQSFLERGHDVLRIDNNPKFKDVPNTVIADVRDIRSIVQEVIPDIVLISPPCECFSVASQYIHWSKEGNPVDSQTLTMIRVVFWCLDAVDYLKPKYWVMENPRGRLRHLIGMPAVETTFGAWGALQVKPTDIWGNIPPGMVWPYLGQFYDKPLVGAGCGMNGKDMRSSKSSERALIPPSMSLAICLAMEKLTLLTPKVEIKQ